ncbi:MAG: hypothetical protein AAF703_12770 [Cyanobacteria bacterium P01_D01_bin.105]
MNNDAATSSETKLEMPSAAVERPILVRGQTADTLFPRDRKEISPYRPRQLVNLFLATRAFFSPTAALGNQGYLAIACWIIGTSITMTRLEQELIKAELGRPDVNLNIFELILGWPIFWALALALGLVAGWLFWFVGGWWFRLRLRFSGATNPDPRMSRLVMVYAGLVSALPHLVFVLWWMLLYENYLAAYAQDVVLTAVLFALSFWELFVAYRGIRKLFSVDRWRARLWFVILPALMYLTTFGLVAAIFVLSQ